MELEKRHGEYAPWITDLDAGEDSPERQRRGHHHSRPRYPVSDPGFAYQDWLDHMNLDTVWQTCQGRRRQRLDDHWTVRLCRLHQPGTVALPDRVVTMDGTALFGTAALDNIAVRSGNSYFAAKDGVHFEKSGATLVAWLDRYRFAR